MPLYDRLCGCGWQAIDCWESVNVTDVLCPLCGSKTDRAWLTKASAVIGDECDFVSHNGESQPIRFRSRAEHRRWLKEKGYRIKDEHKGEPGSDKSKHTSNWAAAYDPYTAENVRILIERAFHQTADPAEEPIQMNIRTYTGEMTAAEAKKYAEANR